MSSKPTEPRSISSQLVLLFTLAATLLLLCGLGGVYLIVVRHAFEEDNAVLADRVFATRAELKKPEGARVVQDELAARRGGEPAAHWIRVIDSMGALLAQTPEMETILPREIFPAPQSRNAHEIVPTNFRKGGKLFSLVSVPEIVGTRPITIQIAQDRSADDAFRKEFGAILIGVLILGVLAATFIAINVTRRGLHPLAEMTESLERIGPTRLDQRVGTRGWPRELQPMAKAFDRMLDRLENSFTRLSQFSADLAHELRTPVANVLGEAEVSLTKDRSPEEYRIVIESCAAECNRLSAIIENLLFLARAESVDRQIQATEFDGRAALDKIAAYYATAGEERKITITCTGEDKVWADGHLFGRAISNLIENALRFTPDGGNISIHLASEPDRSIVSVADSGSGIPAEHLNRVFDRFYRADASRTSSGTGLGLALVKSIAELHGGVASITSEGTRGTRVTLTFPRRT
jgi:two-component system, OmpR family, heavy metal sensor histidine kinase CusS